MLLVLGDFPSQYSTHRRKRMRDKFVYARRRGHLRMMRREATQAICPVGIARPSLGMHFGEPFRQQDGHHVKFPGT